MDSVYFTLFVPMDSPKHIVTIRMGCSIINFEGLCNICMYTGEWY